MRPTLLASGLAIFGLALGGLSLGIGGCYTVEFDETQTEVYYCQGDDECLDSQTCVQFRCVDDSGPQVEITLPEPLTPVDETETTLIVDYNVANFTISDSDEIVEGQGKVLIQVDDGGFSTVALTEDGVALDISGGLEPGAHRLRVQAVYGDGETAYENPGASAYTVFFVEEQTSMGQDSMRPQIAITGPGPGHAHVVGEALEVSIAVRNFTIVDDGNDCQVDQGCDPWNEDTPECVPDCGFQQAGHAHIYLEPDYPDCLDDAPVGCNGRYILSLRPSESISSNETTATALIPADRFPEAGTFTFTASLQYNDHDPFPNREFVIFDQIALDVIER